MKGEIVFAPLDVAWQCSAPTNRRTRVSMFKPNDEIKYKAGDKVKYVGTWFRSVIPPDAIGEVIGIVGDEYITSQFIADQHVEAQLVVVEFGSTQYRLIPESVRRA